MIFYCIIYLFSFTLFIHSTNESSFQEKNIIVNDQDSFIITIQEELKTIEYRKETLPNDFSYLTYLINFDTQQNQSALYLRSVIKLFSNMLKSCSYINANAFSQLLEKSPDLLSSYFTLRLATEYLPDNTELYEASLSERFNGTVHGLLYSKFSTEYAFFRQDPDEFLKGLSSSITAFAQEELTIQQTRQDLIKFYEIALSKLIWDVETQEQTWILTKKIAEQLATLLQRNIIDDSNDLDDLYWTLLTRYCYFIELTATDMPASFFIEIRNDIRNSANVIFAMKEQDFIVESKASYMQRTLIEAETMAYRYRAGL